MTRIQRRQAIVSGAAAASFCWTRQLPAADDIAPLSFAIVSDTHLGRKDNEAAERNWRRAVAEINSLPKKYQCVLHLGDIVDGGRESQYPIYQETRRELRLPIHEIPGNHDPLKLFKKYVSSREDRSFDLDGLRFVLLNNSRRDSHDGFLPSAKLDWLGRQLEEAKRKKVRVVLCCHVPIHSNRHPDRGWYVKPENGQRAFYDLRERFADQLLACFHGHFHNGIRGWRDHGRTVETLFPSVCYNQNRNLKQHLEEGKATGFFVDELRPGYVLCEIGAGKLRLQYKPLGAELHGEYSSALP